jgi:hypothetical protein
VSQFSAQGGHWRAPDTEKYEVVELDEPLWLEPNKGVAGRKLLKFYIIRLLCQIPHIWGSLGRMSCFYRYNGTLRLKAYQKYMYHCSISYHRPLPDTDYQLNA